MHEAYKRRVTAYLVSKWGRNTSDVVAARLLRLRPESVGMNRLPELAAIHAVRSFLEVFDAGPPAGSV